jgi:hypothetical protein
MIPRRFWSGLTVWVALCIVFSLYFLWTHVPERSNPPPAADAPLKVYKDWSKEKKFPPIEDNFPWGNSMQTRNDFPKIASWNRPPTTHVKEKTPLFIGFTRNVCIPQYLFLFNNLNAPPSLE